MDKVACHAILGDDTINWYTGPVGPITKMVVAKCNEYFGDMFDINPSYEPDLSDDAQLPVEVGSDQELAETLVWWANGGPDSPDEYEFNPLA